MGAASSTAKVESTSETDTGIQSQPPWLIKTVIFAHGDAVPSPFSNVLADHADNSSGRFIHNLQVFLIRRLKDLEDDGSLEEYHPHGGIKYKLPLESLPEHHDVLLSTGIDYVEIRTWLARCNKEHADCQAQSEPSMKLPGLLLIDCLTSSIVPAKPEYSYVALSYVWGSAIRENEYETNLRDRHISRTVEDTMLVVREIGMRYLWVDRYCINHSDPDSKHHVISNMDSIYQQASLTIIAAAGNDAEHGLPGVSQTYRRLDFRSRYIKRNEPSNETSSSVWSTRGWTYQEALLSRRCLIFTDTQTTFQCYSASYRERDPFLEQKWHNTISRIQTGDAIFKTINEYVIRDLTFSSDSLKAFLGILRLYERLSHRPVVHLWGLPIFGPDVDPGSRIFARALLWSSESTASGLIPIEGIPSWSWAGWQGWSNTGKALNSSISPGRRHQESLGPYSNKSAHLTSRDPNVICNLDVRIYWNSKMWTVFEYYDARLYFSSITASILPEPTLYVKGMTRKITDNILLLEGKAVLDSSRSRKISNLLTRPAKEQQDFTALVISKKTHSSGEEEFSCLLLKLKESGVYHRVGTIKIYAFPASLDKSDEFVEKMLEIM